MENDNRGKVVMIDAEGENIYRGTERPIDAAERLRQKQKEDFELAKRLNEAVERNK